VYHATYTPPSLSVSLSLYRCPPPPPSSLPRALSLPPQPGLPKHTVESDHQGPSTAGTNHTAIRSQRRGCRAKAAGIAPKGISIPPHPRTCVLCVYVCVCVCVCVCVNVLCMHSHVCMSKCRCMHVCVYTHSPSSERPSGFQVLLQLDSERCSPYPRMTFFFRD
jgi:hypothetical protein